MKIKDMSNLGETLDFVSILLDCSQRMKCQVSFIGSVRISRSLHDSFELSALIKEFNYLPYSKKENSISYPFGWLCSSKPRCVDFAKTNT